MAKAYEMIQFFLKFGLTNRPNWCCQKTWPDIVGGALAVQMPALFGGTKPFCLKVLYQHQNLQGVSDKMCNEELIHA